VDIHYYSVGSAAILGFAELHVQVRFVIATSARLNLGVYFCVFRVNMYVK